MKEVYVLIYEHKHGRDITAYATMELAEKARIGIVKEFWEDFAADEDDLPKEFPGTSEAADIYFERMYNEECDIQDLYVEGTE